MSNSDQSKTNIRAEELIRGYLSGTLSEEEYDELWALMVENPAYFEHLKLNIGLKKLSESGELAALPHNEDEGDQDNDDTTQSDNEAKVTQLFSGNYTAWIIAAAAVLAVVIGLNLLRVSSPEDATQMFALSPDNSPLIGSIDMMYYESVEAFRDEASEEAFVRRFDESLLAAFSGEYDVALRIYDELIQNYSEDNRLGMVYLNAGIIYYNRSEFPEAIYHFERAFFKEDDDPDFNEKAAWLLANAQLRDGNMDDALQTLHVVTQFEGNYQSEALELIRTIEPYMVPGAIP